MGLKKKARENSKKTASTAIVVMNVVSIKKIRHLKIWFLIHLKNLKIFNKLVKDVLES